MSGAAASLLGMDAAKRTRLDDPLSDVEARLDPRSNRAWALARLEEMFRAGKAPEPLPDGFLAGRLVTMSLASAADRTVAGIAKLWMPWLGKSFDAAAGRGVNVLTSAARLPLKALWPSYEPRVTGDTLEVFPFKTRIAEGEVDRGLDVLKIDYDFDANPGFIIRRILDELVEVDDGFYLGRILYRYRGTFRPIGFFSLQG